MNTKHHQEAEQVSLIFISKADKSFGSGYQNYNLYKYKTCGHLEFLQPTHVRRNHIKCSICYEDTAKNYANTIGLELLGKSEFGGTYRRFRIQKCNHFSDITISNLFKRKDDFCTECFENNLKQEAISVDLTLVGKSKKLGTYRTYKFNSCGHIQDITSPCVRVGRFQCAMCKEDAYSKTATSQGLVYLGESTTKCNDNHKRSYRLPCGHVRDLRMSHVAESRWQCDICEDSYLNKPSLIYLLKMNFDNFTWLKLGFARDIQSRVWGYKLSKNVNWSIVDTVNLPSGADAIKFEKNIHKVFKEQSLNKTEMKNFLSNGNTECYPFTIEQELRSEITKLKERTNE